MKMREGEQHDLETFWHRIAQVEQTCHISGIHLPGASWAQPAFM